MCFKESERVGGKIEKDWKTAEKRGRFTTTERQIDEQTGRLEEKTVTDRCPRDIETLQATGRKN